MRISRLWKICLMEKDSLCNGNLFALLIVLYSWFGHFHVCQGPVAILNTYHIPDAFSYQCKQFSVFLLVIFLTSSSDR